MLSPKENDRILDVCSAPGGKSFTSYLLTNGKSEIISCDKYEQRVNLIEKSSKKLGFTIKTIVNDATIFNENLGFFDCVICDVPCSGIGVIRRKPEIKYKDVNDFKELYDLQKNIIDVSLKYVNKGGKFLYSTCTLNKKENQEMVEYLLKNNPDFKLLEQKTILPKDFNGDGFFAAVLLRG